MDLQTQNNVPQPPPKRRTGVTAALRAMAIGDSMLVPLLTWQANSYAYRVFGKGNFRAKKEHGGTRIWRIR